jgi:hypothetical protein
MRLIKRIQGGMKKAAGESTSGCIVAACCVNKL